MGVACLVAAILSLSYTTAAGALGWSFEMPYSLPMLISLKFHRSYVYPLGEPRAWSGMSRQGCIT